MRPVPPAVALALARLGLEQAWLAQPGGAVAARAFAAGHADGHRRALLQTAIAVAPPVTGALRTAATPARLAASEPRPLERLPARQLAARVTELLARGDRVVAGVAAIAGRRAVLRRV